MVLSKIFSSFFLKPSPELDDCFYFPFYGFEF